MNHIAPEGSIYQAGTLSGNPIAMVAGYTTINKLNHNSYTYIEALAERLIQGLSKVAHNNHIPLKTTKAGTMIGYAFIDHPLQNFDDAQKIDAEMFRRFIKKCLNRVYFYLLLNMKAYLSRLLIPYMILIERFMPRI